MSIKNALFAALLLAGCDVPLAPADAPHQAEKVGQAGTWSLSFPLVTLSSSSGRYASALAVGPGGPVALAYSQHYRNGSFYESSVMGLSLDGSTDWGPYLEIDPYSVSAGSSVAAEGTSTGAPCAAWTRTGRLSVDCDAVQLEDEDAGAHLNLALALAPDDQLHLAWPVGSDAVRVRAPDGSVTDHSWGQWSLGAVALDVGPDGTPWVLAEVLPTSGGARELHLLHGVSDGSWTDEVVYDGSVAGRPGGLSVAVSEVGVAYAYVRTTSDYRTETVVVVDGVEEVLGSDDGTVVEIEWGPRGVLHAAWVGDGAFQFGVLLDEGWTSEVLTTRSYEFPVGLDDVLDMDLDGAGVPHVIAHDGGIGQVRWFQRSDAAVAPLPAVLTVDDLVHGDLVVTEIMANPADVSDHVGEWFEVYNPGSVTIDLAGLQIEDEFGHSGLIEASVLLAPGAFGVLGRRDAAKFAGAGVSPIGFYGYQPALNNGGDEVRLVGPQGLIDASMRYGSAASGVALQLSADRLTADDNDDASAWCVVSATPSTDNDLCP